MASSVDCIISTPSVIKFAFCDLTIENDKWRAKCKICKTVLVEKKGTTSAFTQ